MSETQFDIAIVGAGIAGASVAAELARTHHVVLLEREEFPGYHSTGRSAALFSEIYGNATIRALSRASRAFFYSPPATFAQGALVRPRGSLYIARADQIAQLQSFASNEDVTGAIRTISAAQALAACPILRPEHIGAALFEADAVDVDVDALHQGYLRAFRNSGGTLVTGAAVQALAFRGGEWRVETRNGRHRAPIVVNAAGAWADAVARKAGAMPLGIQPCRRTAVLVEMPCEIEADAWPMVIDIEEAFYMKPDAGLLLISPADETPVDPCDVQPEELDVAVAIDRVEHATTLKINCIRKRWAGLRSFAPDRSPIVGFDIQVPNFFWLAAQGGYGIQTAPAISRLAAALVRGESIPQVLSEMDVAHLSPQRFTLGHVSS